MLKNNLQQAIEQLDEIIAFTQEDILLVKEAKHDLLNQRHTQKSAMLSTFEHLKTKLNNELFERSQRSDEGIEAAIEEDEQVLLEAFKAKLLELKEVNRDFASIVVVLNEFYQSLFSSMFTFETQGYNKTKPAPASVLRVSA